WTCRACHAGGGVRDLARRLGLEVGPIIPKRRPRRIPTPPTGLPRDVWADVWSATVDRAQRQDRRLEPHREVYRISEWLRLRHQLVADARRVASVLGDDAPGAWRLLSLAARVSTLAALIEAQLDAVLPDVA